MVDVTVEREKVNVEQARVDVERQSLSNKQEFEEAALKFELEKLRIEAERDVRIQSATRWMAAAARGRCRHRRAARPVGRRGRSSVFRRPGRPRAPR